jgi:hypothetical protein
MKVVSCALGAFMPQITPATTYRSIFLSNLEVVAIVGMQKLGELRLVALITR